MDANPLCVGNDDVAVTVVPAHGGRVVRLSDLHRQVEWLLPGDPATRVGTTSGQDSPSWQDSGRYGWDECFPNISVEPAADFTAVGGRPLADHGQLWSRAWDVLESGRTRMTLAARTPEYTFQRSIQLDGPHVTVDYAVSADSSDTDATPAMPWSWAMHALLPAAVDMSAALPAGAPVTVDYSSVPELAGKTLTWGQETINGWRLGERPDFPIALKLYAAAERPAVLRQAAAWLRIDVAPADVPFLGVWLNYSAWPGPAGDVHVACEPSMTDTDSLTSAVRAGSAPMLRPGHTRRWQVSLEMGGEQ